MGLQKRRYQIQSEINAYRDYILYYIRQIPQNPRLLIGIPKYYCDYKNKDKIQKQVSKKVKQINKSLEKRKVGFKTKFFFKLFGMTQKNGWNKVDSDYWKDKGWLNGKKPY